LVHSFWPKTLVNYLLNHIKYFLVSCRSIRVIKHCLAVLLHDFVPVIPVRI
jgi:hypothetical protein